MLGATTSGALVHNVSIPPRTDELTEQGERDWLTGVELIDTCMATHDTQTYVSMCLGSVYMCTEHGGQRLGA